MDHPKPAPSTEDIRAVISRHARLEGPLLPILRALQEAFGHIPAPAVGLIAETLNVTAAEIHGVVGFYHDFRDHPAGRHVIRICRGEACQAVGAEALAKATLARLGIGWGETAANGAVTIEPVYCLGLCACGPAAMLDDKAVGRVDEARMTQLLEEAGA